MSKKDLIAELIDDLRHDAQICKQMSEVLYLKGAIDSGLEAVQAEVTSLLQSGDPDAHNKIEGYLEGKVLGLADAFEKLTSLGRTNGDR